MEKNIDIHFKMTTDDIQYLFLTLVACVFCCNHFRNN